MRVNREKLAVALVRLDISVGELAKLAGVSRGTVTAVRTGKSCSAQTAEKLAAVCGQQILEVEQTRKRAGGA